MKLPQFNAAILATLMLACAAASASSGSSTNHWAYRPLERPVVPRISDPTWARTPIDAFILAKLQANGLNPAREADKRLLLRRVYFDLVGLPPSPDEITDFLRDESPDAYDQVVDRLLASPRYGERWARHWMDASHFAETHGHDQDRIRTNAWPYRDYLIASFNTDKPYARFVQEQIAGDELFPDDPNATVALGFVSTGPWDESSLRDIREDTLDRQIGRYLDRDDMVTTVMSVFASTTVHCARCHDHKFDPIPQQDYYALQAVFAGVDRANRVFDADAKVHRKRQGLLREKRRAEADDRSLLLGDSVQREVADWEHSHAEHKVEWKLIEPQTFVSLGGAAFTKQPDSSLLAHGPRPERDTYTITAVSPLQRVTAVRLDVLSDPSLPKKGPGRQDNGNFHLSEFQIFEFEPGAAQAREVALVNPSADFNQSGWTIAQALDRNEKTAWGIHPRVGESHRAVFELKAPLELSSGATLVIVLKQLHGEGHLIGRPRLAVTDAQRPVRLETLPADIEKVLAAPATQRMDEQRTALAAFVVKQRVDRELAKLPRPSFVYAAASDFEPDGGLKPVGAPRPVHLLKRGEITNPGELVAPGALTCISGLPARFQIASSREEAERRAALAQWLANSKNPLTWRSIVNRVWQYHFGRGLVETPNDFGRMGSAPSHPELLDWMAVWFRDEARGSLKQLHRLIVTSAVYRQGSRSADILVGKLGGFPASQSEGLAPQSEARMPRNLPAGKPALRTAADATTIDQENLLFSRMNCARLDAEQLRDAVLAISGRLDLRMGGPSDMQFDLQPGIHVTPRVDYSKFDLDSRTGSRRSVYRFLFRTLPDPFMDALDCPAGDQLTAVRNASVTVQQALALWNNAFMARQAERFAARLARETGALENRIALACELVWGRPPTPGEARDLAAYVAQHGLANFCRVLFNSNEFIFVN